MYAECSQLGLAKSDSVSPAKSAKPCRGKPFDLRNELARAELESQKGNRD
jgi:hypothetical protein